MVITLNCKIFLVAKSADDIYPVKMGSSFDIFYFFTSRRTGIFTLQIRMHTTFINVYTLFRRNSV